MLKSQLVEEYNIKEAIRVQNIIFPRENGRMNYEESVKNIKNLNRDSQEFRNATKYFLVKYNEASVGIWGIYTLDDKFEAWLGWYGVLPEFRKCGYGKQIFEMFESFCKQNGFTTIRLYTDEIENSGACKLYEKLGMLKEYYQNPNDVTEVTGKILIYSKSLTNKKVKPWNSKFINLKEQIKKQDFYKKQ